MLAQSPSNKILACLLGLSKLACAQTSNSIEDMRTNGDWQGLYEVRQVARQFISKWNGAHKSNYEALEPNLKNGATSCGVPLHTRWVTKDYGMHGLNVFVICDKTVDSKVRSTEKWKIVVPVIDLNNPTIKN